ncbi:bifunctional 2-keto-4-hydroxyglutarate aldolase/2-keto-3-deoxy-6-phosphogluconate aldolase [Paenibacillus marchantiophytorum]|uniref:Bifunctional 2-keto-4-hydroxyglutarate aldolase/2-keto-3-deoxy-6-phosphogluconate aldolase n=1 Tax=Paenibacillus marchantiophytorum TaxID=1619310 RepID=A0ABQ1EYK1_9BACL|nr:bifunctional 2-keto-4-hydroxyglutarate aldolase/2-keto-3-deoxy-6-phosphogluconate aldolase [Paenibacillus marchantiophytorum]GFZ91691.1 bifunctional 2-keto-4-hydroxyglutarate aldolase/2-keto-3-deoxy-6-phosphogluconate aldolase [Paenibacillus marchantiophytorum]
MEKELIIAKIKQGGLVAVVRAEDEKQAEQIAIACMAGGIKAIEITFTIPGAERIIASLAQKFDPHECLIGAGTVLDAETARTAILAGARYIVSPYLNIDTVTLCHRYRVPIMPGAMTIKEVAECLEAGADIIKVFPGELFGPAFIKAVKGPLPHAQLMPTGGVTIQNVSQWMEAGAVAVGVGGSLTAGANTGDYQAITDTAQAYMALIKKAQSKGLAVPI